MKRNKFPNHKKAFTLIELLVVVAIISLLTSIVLNSLAGARMKANDAKIAQDLRQFRIAAELYYNDNHSYPPISMVNQENVFSYKNESNTLSNKLVFFVKTAEASILPHHATALCDNFDKVADSLVNLKYLSSRPVHPYDNDASGICYKAVSSNVSFASYAVLTTQVSTTGGNLSKRTGFIVGDTSLGGINSINSAVSGVLKSDGSIERGYPAGSDGAGSPFDSSGNMTSIDSIGGITDGSPTASGGISGFVDTVASYFNPPPLPPPVPPYTPIVQ